MHYEGIHNGLQIQLNSIYFYVTPFIVAPRHFILFILFNLYFTKNYFLFILMAWQ